MTANPFPMGETMSELLETLVARLRVLEDREAIRDLIASYGPLAEDGIYEVVGFAQAQGHAAIAALIEGDTHRALMADGCAHLLGPVTVEIANNTASARGHSVVFRHGPEGFAPYRVAANRWTLRRSADGWRVVHRRNALLDGSEAARILLIPDQPAS
jgi:hypothetical protein